MRSQPPCTAWAEKLAHRGEDLSPTDHAALDAHLQSCPACEAAYADYTFLDARLCALPPPALMPLPRLSLQTFLQDKEKGDAEKLVHAGNAIDTERRSLPIKQTVPRAARGFSVRRLFPVACVACLILTFLLIFRFLISSNTSSQPPGMTIFTYTGHSDYVDAVAWSPNSTYVVSTGQDGTAHVWKALGKG